MNWRRVPVQVCLCLALGGTWTAGAQEATPAPPAELGPASILRSADLLADVAVLEQAYTALHPGLHRYNTPAQMDAAFAALAAEFQRDRTLAEAYLAFSVFAAKVKCGHTYANFFNQTEAVQKALFQAPRVPFYFRWLGNRMIVTQSFAEDPRLKAGTEVLAINGIPVETILAKLLTVARADGGNDAKRRAYLEVQGTDRYEAFDVFFPLLFPSTAPRLALRARGPAEERPIELEVRPSSDAERLASMKDAEALLEGSGPFFEFKRLDDGVAYLRMPTWALYDTDWDWRQFLAETFATLASSGATDLVLDVRGNEGGSDVGEVIVSHLISAPVARPAAKRLVRYRKVPEDLVPYLDTWDPSFRDWGAAALDTTEAGFFRLRRDADDDVGAAIQPASPRFGGRTWVLVGPSNSSATFELALMMRHNHLGTLVGQPTGGNQRGINGGAFFFLRLPRTGLELDLPLIGQFVLGDPPDAGLEPDLWVEPTVEDIATGRDAEMAAVRARIRTLAKAGPAPG